ncbi:MAG: hypothetical protein CL912_15110 [Deltaproteobacteria bacterium]|nr:hypothetical protein [Deltaproteobacteria bacterium]
MSDDGPAPGAGGGGNAQAHAHADAIHHYDVPQVPVNASRRSTWTKDMTDVHVSGTQTPMSGMNRMSRLEPGLEDYFVRF